MAWKKEGKRWEVGKRWRSGAGGAWSNGTRGSGTVGITQVHCILSYLPSARRKVLHRKLLVQLRRESTELEETMACKTERHMECSSFRSCLFFSIIFLVFRQMNGYSPRMDCQSLMGLMLINPSTWRYACNLNRPINLIQQIHWI